MAEEVQMEDHRLIARLLPWFVNSTLDAAERHRVQRHLDSCAACQADVSLLSTVKATVRREIAPPMVPPPRTERLLAAIDLAAIDNHDRKKARWRPLTIMAAAASLAALVVVTLLRLPAEQATVEPARYETTTTPALGTSTDYVLDVQFERGVSLAAQERLLRELAAKHVNRRDSGSSYTITVSLQAASLEELERYTDDLESLREIRAVNVVAVQLPMKRQQ